MSMKNKTILLIIIIFILTLGIGYASIETNINMDGTVNIEGNTFRLYEGNIALLSSSNVTGTVELSNNNKTVNFNTTLAHKGEKFEFVFYVYNTGTLDAMLNSTTINGTENASLEFTLSYADGQQLERYDKFPKNSSKPLKISLEYIGDVDNTINVTYAVTLNFTKASSGAVEKTINYTPPTPTASIGTASYSTLQEAINDASASPTTITLNMDTEENITIPNGSNIVIDLQSHTLSKDSNYLVTNNGTVQITNGKLIRTGTNDQRQVINNTGTMTLNNVEIKHESYSAVTNTGTINFNSGKIWLNAGVDQGVVNNNAGGTFNMTGGQIIGSKRQAVYNNGGTLNISGSSYLENQSNATRACVHNVSGTTTITGGTIISNKDGGIKLEKGIVTIGSQGGTLDTSSPEIRGYTYGVYITSTGTLNWYDGILKGITNYIDGTVTGQEQNTQPHTDTEVIGSNTYNTAYLETKP